ncbi:hypothetical protein H6P81_020654 [Aristolochia fimbriata]|uniref:Uncharacterized protein n=1 Tax=Aristolochia fimbriata TaxID=158543 RepID=A0AAV7DW40_ARIFI|nr:hypothetical protein H6P81_020654 [Aristolochia fimbriata]
MLGNGFSALSCLKICVCESSRSISTCIGRMARRHFGLSRGLKVTLPSSSAELGDSCKYIKTLRWVAGE